MLKWTMRGMIAVAVVAGAGFLLLGTELPSYCMSSVRTIKESVKDNVPIEFEIKRARDLLEELEPELVENIRQVAREEVEIEVLASDVREKAEAIRVEKAKLERLRDTLRGEQVSFTVGNRSYSRAQLVAELSRRLTDVESAEAVLATKCEILANRRAAFDTAVQQLETARNQRAELAAQIEALEGEHRLQQARSEGTSLRIDDSKLAQTKRLITELRKRLEVQKRVLASEARFVEEIPVEAIETEDGVLERVDSYLAKEETATY